MNLGFSADHEAMRLEFRKLLARSRPRAAFDTPRDASGIGDIALWQQLAELGWLATAVPEAHGGSGLGPLVLCVLAEEAGRHLAAVPFTASACGFTHALLPFAGEASVQALLAELADGSARGVLLTDECWPKPALLKHDTDTAATLGGRARNVLDGRAATHALACFGQGAAARLVLLTLDGVARNEAAGMALDLLHPCCDFAFEELPVQVLASGAAAQSRWDQIVDAHALFVAFEQLGGAQAALDAARRYSLERYAFGRAIGSFQALKHLMADMLVGVDLARSNCYFGAAALASGGEMLCEAAAVARISATDAFRACAAGSTQVHGALGVTWEADCHLFYRRAQALAASPGSQRSWKERLVALLRRRAAVAPFAEAVLASDLPAFTT
jgi:alkylation response protein AidB-like acyl-CoA dehydrogenase